MSTISHAAKDARRANPVQTRRETHPIACTTSTAVRELILMPTLNQRAIADLDLKDLVEAARHTSDPAVIEPLRRIGSRIPQRVQDAATAAGKADECAAKLEQAEDAKCWDALADMTIFTGREIAGFINGPLDVIRRMDLTFIRDAQAALVPFFEQLGDGILERRVLAEVGVKRGRVLAAEYERWRTA